MAALLYITLNIATFSTNISVMFALKIIIQAGNVVGELSNVPGTGF
jgi:hypothetical protein